MFAGAVKRCHKKRNVQVSDTTDDAHCDSAGEQK